MSRLTDWIRTVFNLRRGEYALTALMFSYYYLILLTYYFLKPARDSLFLVKLGSDQLPLVFILIALIVVPVTSAYSRASLRFKLSRLIDITTVILIANLFLIRWLVLYNADWVYYLFYIWVSIFGVLTTSQFWLLANSIYNAEQAKRLFVLLNLGGIVGAISGGEITSIVVKRAGVSTENLLYFCVAFLLLSIVVLKAIWALKRRDRDFLSIPVRRAEEPREGLGQLFASVNRSKHLLLIVGIISMTMMTGTFVDFQFKAVTVAAFPLKEDLTAFLGKFYGRLSLVSLIIQLLLTYNFIKILGVRGIILFLPLGLLTGSVAMLVFPGLWAGVMLRGADGSFKYSIDKTGRELLFLPVPLELKKRTKVFIDMFVDRFSRGIAGVLLLVAVKLLGLSIQQISLIVLVLLGCWIALVFLIRTEYVNAFREAIKRREIDPGQLRSRISGPTEIKALIGELARGNEREVAYALEMLTTAKGVDLTAYVCPLLKHESAEIRRKAVDFLGNQGARELCGEIELLLADKNAEVQLAAMNAIYQLSDGSGREALPGIYLYHRDPRIQAVALASFARHGAASDLKFLDRRMIESLLERNDKLISLHLARALGDIKNTGLSDILIRLMSEKDSEVAGEAIRGAGNTGDRSLVPHLIGRLSDRRQRRNAREALASFGNRILGTLSDYLLDSNADYLVRKEIIRVMGRIPTQASANTVCNCIESLESTLKYECVKVLSSFRRNYQTISFNKKQLDALLFEQTRIYCELLHVFHLSGAENSEDGNRLLARALREKLDLNLEELFRILGLRYLQKDISSAYLGLVSGRKSLRASSIEFLDNILGGNNKKYILPLLDPDSADYALEHGRKFFGVDIANRDEGLKYLIGGNDPWLKACALYNISKSSGRELIGLAENAVADADPLVSETASLALRNMG